MEKDTQSQEEEAFDKDEFFSQLKSKISKFFETKSYISSRDELDNFLSELDLLEIWNSEEEKDEVWQCLIKYEKDSKINYDNNNIYSTLNNTEINPSTTNDSEIINSLGNSQTFNYPNNYSNLFPSLTFNKSIQRNSFKKKKLKIPTVDELFDFANNEGEKEAIIDDELHSDEEIVFQPKVKQAKKIIKKYLPKVKEKVPKLSLSLIEYNKMKIMNEADLYSYNKRQEQLGNADENIKIMKNKVMKY